MLNGKYTVELGYRLYKKYIDTKYQIFYDPHKNKNLSSPNACEPTPFFNKYSSLTSLSNVDIVVLNIETNLVEILIEIEEEKAEPKKIIGDIGSIILSEQIKINDKIYNYGNLFIILGLKVFERGSSREKTNNICKKLNEINKILDKKVIEIITIFDEDLRKLVNKIEYKLDEILRIF